MSKAKYVNFKTPRGVAKWPKLDQPYSWSNAQNRSVPDPAGQYEVILVVPEADAAPLIKTIKDAIKESGIDPKNLPFKKEVDGETKKPTGKVEFKLKAYGKTKDGKKQTIKMWDAKARPAPGIVVTPGSEIRVNGYISVAKLGCRLSMNEIQVLNLAATQSGFDAEDDGYEYDPDDVTNNNNEDNEADTAPEDDDTDF